MAKKWVLGLVLATLVAGGVFAQHEPKNWISGQVGLLGGGAGYERVLTPSLSVGGEVYWNSLFLFWNSFALEGSVKFYPFQGVFYVKGGLGFGTVTGTEDVSYAGYSYSWWYQTSGFLIDPGVGWKIDVGQPGGFFIEPKVSVPIVLGKKEYDAWAGYKDNGQFKVGVNILIAFGMGYAF
ncbi:hypothetical protein AGMMS50293_07990 [Spirochaetia bacterium]|nr:hypothetical protein AGMMS50293_07990 [Spirochaetia bacterium]